MKVFCVFLILTLLFIPSVLIIRNRGEAILQNTSAQKSETFPYTVILDAGHGGEDGGAVAADGTAEKDLNLLISNDIADFFNLFGIPFVAVRTTDESVGDTSLQTVRARKTSDILNRFDLINKTPDSILLSIHQNQFGKSEYYGTQVFYSPNDPLSEILANSIQKCVVQNLQQNNSREVKPSGDSIYLLFRAERPSVLVECGFLSNPNELAALKDPVYQSQMAYSIIEGLYFCLTLH